MAAITAGVVGAVALGGGAFLSSKAEGDAASQAAAGAGFRPFTVDLGSGGGVDASRAGEGLITTQQNPDQEVLGGLFSSGAINELSANGPNAGFLNFTQGLGDDFQQSFNEFNATQNQGLATQQQALAGFDAGNRNIQQGFNTLGQDQRSQLGQPGLADASANFAINQGQGLLGQDVRGTVDSTLANLRAQARPQEERAVDSRIQDLFSRGTLSSTSGARSIGELGQVQQNADLQRQLMAEQLGQSQFGLQQQAGQGLLFGGQNALFAGAQNNQNIAGMNTQLGLSGLNQQTQANQGLFGATTQFGQTQSQFGADRLGAVQGLFGFGSDIDTAGLNRALAGNQGVLSQNADLRNLVALSGNLGSAQATAGAAQGNIAMQGAGSPIGAGLMGFGSGLTSGIFG